MPCRGLFCHKKDLFARESGQKSKNIARNLALEPKYFTESRRCGILRRMMTIDGKAKLRAAGFSGRIETEWPLAAYTTWRIGGPAELLAEPATVEDLQLAVRWAASVELPWRVLGNGSNLLVRDEGVRGLVLRIRKVLDGVDLTGSRLVAGAGAFLPGLVRLSVAHGLSGIEFCAGIPGTLGGAVVMNAGWHENELGNVIESVDVMDTTGEIHSITRDACGFAYRHSRFREEHGIILSARLLLKQDDPVALQQRLEQYAASRKANQPTSEPSCGSVFLKPPGDFAGRLIEEAGLKGQRVGAIQVSPKHANFFINLGGGTAADALALVERVELEIEDRFGVTLTREFELW
jgi:UDP-N-acetylmuramate dehydrogenase